MVEVVKIGSACVLDEDGNIRYNSLRKKAEEILDRDGVILVVSGAIAYGKMLEGDTRHNDDLSSVELQGYACSGQIELMNLYNRLLKGKASQLLVTNEDLRHDNHVRDLVQHNVARGRVTVANYNDGVDWEQLRLDNETLAATLLLHCDADRLVVLGQGYSGFVGENGLVPHVSEVTDKMYDLCKGKSVSGNGGFTTKLDAAKMVLQAGKEMIIGNIDYRLDDLIEGWVERTVFR